LTNSSITRDNTITVSAREGQQYEEPDGYAPSQSLLAKADEAGGGVNCPYEIDPVSDPRWAQFVDSRPRASLFHDPRWLCALETAYGYHPLAFTTASPGMPLRNGIVFCEISSWLTGRRLVSLPFSDHCEPLASEPGDLEPLLLYARQKVDAGRYKRFEIRPMTYVPPGAAGLGKNRSYVFHRLDLRPPAETIFRGFHKDCIQRKIRRAERENLLYEDGNSDELLEKFLGLMMKTRRRHGIPPQPPRWFRALLTAFGKDLKIRVASKDGVPVASILTISRRRTVVFKYGCSDHAASRFGGTPMLFWRTIQEAKDNGQDELDMGRSDADNEGLITFKEHWGALPTRLQYWSYPGREWGASDRWLAKVGRTVTAVVPDSVLQMFGSVLYRHMG